MPGPGSGTNTVTVPAPCFAVSSKSSTIATPVPMIARPVQNSTSRRLPPGLHCWYAKPNTKRRHKPQPVVAAVALPIVAAVVQPVAKRLSRIEALLLEMRFEQDVLGRRTQRDQGTARGARRTTSAKAANAHDTARIAERGRRTLPHFLNCTERHATGSRLREHLLTETGN